MTKKVLIGFCILILLTSCISLEPVLVTKVNNATALLQVFRRDAPIAGRGDVIKVYLNDVFITQLDNPDTYKSIYVLPGEYTIKYEIVELGETAVNDFSWTDPLIAGTQYVSGVGFAFGWQCRSEYLSMSGIDMTYFDGQIDAMDIVSPK